MSGGVFRARGGTGQAPTTTFFGYVPDRFNMLRPMHVDFSAGVVIDSTITSANNVNQWTIFNSGTMGYGGSSVPSVSLGANAAAPDGLSNAQKIVESNQAGFHYLTAGFVAPSVSGSLPGSNLLDSRMRIAVFAKAAERTRIVLAFANTGNNFYAGGNINSGCRAVFDLAGGQIAVANTKFGPDTSWVAGPASIMPFGNGWYCCMIDMLAGTGGVSNTWIGLVLLDAGSGTNAENTSYTGNGSNGVYTWKATCLPATAWSMSGAQIFYDDFNDNTMAEFDLTNSLAPGFKWYINGAWPGPGYTHIAFGSVSPIPNIGPGQLISVANSVLTLPKWATVIGGNLGSFYALMPAASTGGTGYVGRAFSPPMIVEEIVAYQSDFNTQFPGGSAGGNFSTGLASMVNANYSDGPGLAHYLPHLSWSAVETLYDLRPSTTMFAGNSLGGNQNSIEWMQDKSFNGIEQWYNAVGYNGIARVFYGGSIYQAFSTPTVGVPPPSEPTAWTAVASPSPPVAQTKVIEWGPTHFHTFSTLWIPTTATDRAQMITFMDGVFAAYIGSYSRVQMPFPTAENSPAVLLLLPSSTFGHLVDSISIRQ